MEEKSAQKMGKMTGAYCTLREDRELKLLRRRRMAEMRRRLEKRTEGRKGIPKRVLGRVLVGRAWEVLDAAESQYPEATRQVEECLARLVSSGELRGPINGGQLLWLFRRLGVNVRLETRIRILEHGELKTMEEKLRES